MADLVILGTDTDAGKTAFALLWLHAFGDRWDYWKPVETGPSDTATIQRLAPHAFVHPPCANLPEAVAPPLAARRANVTIPSAVQLTDAIPTPSAPGRGLLIETFGGPLSPLNEHEAQIDFIRRLDRPCVLVSSSKLGVIGRTRAMLQALAAWHITPFAVVLLGPPDDYAVEQLTGGFEVVSLELPAMWDIHGFAAAAQKQRSVLEPLADKCSWTNFHPRIPFGLSQEILESDRRCVWHPYTSLRGEPPLEVVAAQDEFLTLADGRRVIDGISSWWTILHGHRNRLLLAVLEEALQQIDHVHFAGVTHAPAVYLAEQLLRTTGWPEGRVFYSDNGSTAVEVALKMAYQFWCHQGQPERTLFIGFQHGYHGDTFGAMAASRDPVFFGTFEPLLFQARIIPVSAEALDEELRRHPGRVAAVIIEPLLQAAGGMRLHTALELRAIFEVTRRHDVLFIADEVMTGCGRLGPLWAHLEAGIEPDLLCTAKTLAGGLLPLAATLATSRIVAAFDSDDRTKTFFHGHSFTAHPLACAVAVANLGLLDKCLPGAPRRIEDVWQRELAALCDHPRVREVRIKGSMGAVELDVPGGYLADVGRQLRQSCLERGVLLRPLGNVLYALPPLGTSDGSLQRIAAAMTAAVQALWTKPGLTS